MRGKHVTATIRHQRNKVSTLGSIQLLNRLVVLLGLQQDAREAQSRHSAQFVVGPVVGKPGETAFGSVHSAFVELHLRCGQGPMISEGGAREPALQITENAPCFVDVAGLHRAIELVEHRTGFEALVALVDVPSVPSGVSPQHSDQHPSDEVAVGFPERFERVELFLLLQVERCGHGGRGRSAKRGAIMRCVGWLPRKQHRSVNGWFALRRRHAKT